VHIPKTGGVNFKRRIPKKLIRGEFHYPKDTKLPLYYWWHQPISYQIKYNSNLANIPWLTIVRHPADRLLSFYLFIKRRLREFGLLDWNITFEDYIKNNGIKSFYENGLNGYNRWPQFVSEGGIWKSYDSQCCWVFESKNVLTFRMEDQLEELEDYVGFHFTDTRHNSTIHDSWEIYYTDEMREIVYERYKEDFERFDYGFN
jgi:hypothetical protein